MTVFHSLLLLTALLLQPGSISNVDPAHRADPCAVQPQPADQKRYPVQLDSGIAWGLVPIEEASDQPTRICFSPYLERPEARTVVILPPYAIKGQEKAFTFLSTLQAAGDWLVIGYGHQVPGWAQPSGFQLEALQPTTGQRLLIWEGMVTGGSHMDFAIGSGAAVVAHGVTAMDGIGPVSVTYVRFDDNYRTKLPITGFPRSLRYHDGAFQVVDGEGRLHRFDNATGKPKKDP